MRDLLTILRSLGVALLMALFAMAVWQWGEPVQPLTYGCFSGPGWFAVQFHDLQIHAKAIAVGSGVLLSAEFAMRLLLNIRDTRTERARGLVEHHADDGGWQSK